MSWLPGETPGGIHLTLGIESLRISFGSPDVRGLLQVIAEEEPQEQWA